MEVTIQSKELAETPEACMVHLGHKYFDDIPGREDAQIGVQGCRGTEQEDPANTTNTA